MYVYLQGIYKVKQEDALVDFVISNEPIYKK
mgnify:CR=1 FL=1